MRAIKVCALAALLVACANAQSATTAFQAFKAAHGKKYASVAEEAHRFKIFEENMKKASELQMVNPLATFGANAFADMSAREFKAYHNGERAFRQARRAAKRLPTVQFSEAERAAAAGQSQDWRPKGAVTPIKNQGQCGSCWSFSTTGGIEGQWFLAGNKLTSLSEQELVSCDTIDHGCDGGLMDNAFQWLLQTHNGSIVTEASYAYVSGNGNVPACSMSGTQFGAQIDGFNNVAQADMATFVYGKGPLSIAVDAESWQTYMGGILTNCPSGQLDHGVLIVGFDDNSDPPYWVIKNSWGTSWGESGYIRVQKNAPQCSIGQYQTSATVKKAGPTPPPGPTPPTPPTPPGPSGDFVQKRCRDATCKDCEEERFPQNKCISRNSASYLARCDSNALIVKEYASKDCTGSFNEISEATDVCAIVLGSFDSTEFYQVSCTAGPSPPGPTPPSPPTPPAPTPSPPTATFEQKQCSDAQCSQGCSSHTFPQNSCLQLTGGGSATAVCSSTELQMTVYPMSNDCTGMSEASSQPINQCLADQQGTYFENICNNGGAVAAALEHVNVKAITTKRA